MKYVTKLELLAWALTSSNDKQPTPFLAREAPLEKMMNNLEFIEAARDYAFAEHTKIGQTYDGQPYSVHLEEVAGWVREFSHLLPAYERSLAEAGAYLHDMLEDCRVTYNDVLKACGSSEVAEIAYLLATPKGRNRAERHCDAYYQEMAGHKLATFVKLCDRLANAAHSRRQGPESRMLVLYQKEQAYFSKFLRPAWPEFDQPGGPWQRLDMLLDEDLPATPN